MTEPHLLRRPGVLAVHSVNRFVYSVPDLAEAERFYAAFGLDVRRVAGVDVAGAAVGAQAGRLDLHTHGHPHCWASIYQGGGAKALQYLSLGVDAADMAAWRDRIGSAGLGCAPHPLCGDPPGTALWLTNPDAIALQLVAAPKVSPSEKCARSAPAPAVAPGQGAAPARSKVAPVRPGMLSHVLFFTPDVPRMVAFGSQVLGLGLSDRSGEAIAFMHGMHGSDHHLMAFAKAAAPGLHHSSWSVGSIDEVGAGAEQMRNAGHTQGWGLGRHVLGSNYFHYVRDPWGSYAEYSFDIDFVPHDLDWPSADHPPQDSFYVWGPAVPADFVTNFEQPAGAA